MLYMQCAFSLFQQFEMFPKNEANTNGHDRHDESTSQVAGTSVGGPWSARARLRPCRELLASYSGRRSRVESSRVESSRVESSC